MWNRRELKERAKIAFKGNYWKAVAVSALMMLIGGGMGAYTAKNGNTGEVANQFSNISSEQMLAIAIAVLGGIAVIGTVSFILRVFVLNPLNVGCQKFFKENSAAPAELSELGEGFKNSYGHVVLTTFLADLFLALWTLLFVIPGIVKSYSYRMVPYIISDYPELSATEAITKSREMMKGHKFDAFVLDLSFIGWYILTALTFGILGIFYVCPYVFQTDAELYLALKND